MTTNHLACALAVRSGIAIAAAGGTVPPAVADADLIVAYDDGILDYSGNGNDTGVTWAEARYGYAAEFDVGGDETLIPDSDSLQLSTAMTLEAWSYPADTGKFQFVVDRGTYSDTSYALGAVGHIVNYQRLTAFSARQRHAGQPLHSSAVRANTGPPRIGRVASEIKQFSTGRIDEVRIYRRALTVEEIHTNMKTPVG
ncbi:LamG-like jellyroll fold domain-containing protein [Nonomuraea sp. NPDC050536]|uniref:LamG-like jellyroll fold domain-containing protein n=1 Tax=Nonomuraea sp. NPDC050536 TaxID=3364366 RepID=UPI0037C90BB9